ncbi:hypothetical protein CEXT_695841 [Caerostris extrusa]|nr:hypothetical protein CEXT_695841 [Caerostris extrusa]
MSPAKKRRAHSQEREVSRKRQRVDAPLHQRSSCLHVLCLHCSSCLPARPASTAARHQTSTTTQFVQLNPAPARRPGRPVFFSSISEKPDPGQGSFEEVLEELRQEYQGAVLSDQVPTSNNEEMEDYLKSLWAAARKVTKENRRKVVTKHDIMSALYNWADIIL